MSQIFFLYTLGISKGLIYTNNNNMFIGMNLKNKMLLLLR